MDYKIFLLFVIILISFVLCSSERAVKFDQEIPDIYLYRLPPEYHSQKQYPLVVALHGYLSDENKPISLWDVGFFYEPNFILLSLRAPFSKRKGGFTWFAESESLLRKCRNRKMVIEASLTTCEERILRILEQFEEKFKIDPNRRYLWGLSLGGPVALYVGLKNPSLFAGIIAGSPSIDTLFLSLTNTDDLRDVDIFLSVGEKESGIYNNVKKVANLLKKRGANVRLYTHEGGHIITAKECRTFQNFLDLSYTIAPEDNIDYKKSAEEIEE